VQLTGEGLAMLDLIDDLACRADLQTLEDLTPDKRHSLMALMAQVVEAKGTILDC
jgi:hypothetical protein